MSSGRSSQPPPSTQSPSISSHSRRTASTARSQAHFRVPGSPYIRSSPISKYHELREAFGGETETEWRRNLRHKSSMDVDPDERNFDADDEDDELNSVNSRQVHVAHWIQSQSYENQERHPGLLGGPDAHAIPSNAADRISYFRAQWEASQQAMGAAAGDNPEQHQNNLGPSQQDPSTTSPPWEQNPAAPPLSTRHTSNPEAQQQTPPEDTAVPRNPDTARNMQFVPASHDDFRDLLREIRLGFQSFRGDPSKSRLICSWAFIFLRELHLS
ncbi:hypothetical protein C8J57DRAFT_1262045 [Mycena rebaudengoi]|nr:hypothetical protein C8J57DRAFT_1262045 [Mycena rebaudengoi]